MGKVSLVQFTDNGEGLIEDACRCCYQSWNRKHPPESTALLIRDVIAKGHFSVLEHAAATFKLENVSRVLTHELVRHRLFSFSQESQRYVCYADKGETDQPGRKGKPRKKTKDYSYTTPPDIIEGGQDLMADDLHDNVTDMKWTGFDEIVEICYQYYEFLLSKGINPEDARYILPNATNCDIYVTGNLRTWRHFVQLRTHPRSAWEIRFVANEIKDILKDKFPNVFYDYPLGPMTEEDFKNVIPT